MIFTQLEETLYSIADVVSIPTFRMIQSEFIRDFLNFEGQDNDDFNPDRLGTRRDYGFLGESLPLINLGTSLLFEAQRVLKKRMTLRSIVTNIMYKCQDTPYHTDGPSDYWSLVIFTTQTWNSNWGGDFFIKYDNVNYRGVPYFPNHGVLFRSDLQHRGAAGNILSQSPRLSIAFTYQTYD